MFKWLNRYSFTIAVYVLITLSYVIFFAEVAIFLDIINATYAVGGVI